jgi:hypothetical protein
MCSAYSVAAVVSEKSHVALFRYASAGRSLLNDETLVLFSFEAGSRAT